MILKKHGFGPTLSFWPSFLKSEDFMLMQDSYNGKFAELVAYFGFDHEKFASQIVDEIARSIWLAEPNTFPDVTIGSWKD